MHQIGVVGGVVGGIVAGLARGEKADRPQSHHAVTWKERALVFESGSHTGESRETGVWSERREVWSLDADGRLHVVITTRGSGDAPRTVALVFRRRE